MKTRKKYNNACLLKSILATITLLFLSANIGFAGHKNYYLKTTVDYGGFGLLYEIITDDGNGGGGTNQEYAEESLGYNFKKVKHYGNICNSGYDSSIKTNHLTINFNHDRGTPEKRVANYAELQKDVNDEALVFSFPGLKGENGGYKATSNDYTRASQVGETLVTGLNQAILFMRNNAESDLVSNHSLNLLLGKISYTSELSSASSFSITLGSPGTTYKITRADAVSENYKEELIPINGLAYSDYVQIKVTSGSNKGLYSYFPWRMEKGYYPGDSLAKYVGSYADKAKGVENEYLTWGQLILQAMLLTDVTGASEQDFASDVQTIIGQGLGSDLTGTISSVRSLLGLSSMSELVLNMGSRPSNYHLGVMSKDMHNISLTVYTLNLMISLAFIGFMIVKMLHQKMLATTNIVAKTTLMEGIKDLAFVAIMLGFFAPLFETLLELNFLIVRTFSYSSEYMSTFTALGNKSLSMESMAGFMVSSMFLSIDIYINFVYLVRAITVSFLFSISPIIIVSYLWSPAQKNLVFGFFRELVGNIFMQSFHAITMTFFSAYNMTNMSSIEALASAYCFIPITQLFRQLVLGNSGGFSEKIGGKLAGQMTTTAMGMQKSAMQAKQSKEMFTAQAKAQADIAKGQVNGQLWQQGFSTAGSAVTATTSAIGSLGGPLGTAVGAGIGAVLEGGLNMIGTKIGANTAMNATKQAMGELGVVNAKHADQTLGMGLAELGVGLGTSSYDSAGDAMVRGGLQTVQSGAMMSGKAQSMQGAGGDYQAQAMGTQMLGMGYANTFRGIQQGIGNVGRAVQEKGREVYQEKNAVENAYKRIETQNQAQKMYEEDNASQLKQDRMNKRAQNDREALEYLQSNEGHNLTVQKGVQNNKDAVEIKMRHMVENSENMSTLAQMEKSQAINNEVRHMQANPEMYINSGVIKDAIASQTKVQSNIVNHDIKVEEVSSSKIINSEGTAKAYQNPEFIQNEINNGVMQKHINSQANAQYKEDFSSEYRKDNLSQRADKDKYDYIHNQIKNGNTDTND